jgi:dTDP-4-dehydrorhamnose reductase
VRKRILFTGGSGLLALNSALYLRNDFEVYLGLHSRIINLEGVHTCILDLENEQALEKEIIRIKPDILINAAGMTNVEACELKPNEADTLNAIVPGVLARLSKKLNIYFVHISTDHLFDGTKSFQTEEDTISPLNVYGKSKAKGEQEVLKNNNEALIIRTNFFGWGTSYRQSFSDFIIYSLRQEKKITLFEDVYYTPILIQTLIDQIQLLIKDKIKGIINIVSDERISKYDFGVLVAELFGLNKNLIEKGSIKNNKSLIQRPRDMSLSNFKIKNIIKTLNFPSLNEQLGILHDYEKSSQISEMQDKI